jgi:Raf kinase inhibitor-like YbhB/YbcL family protein
MHAGLGHDGGSIMLAVRNLALAGAMALAYTCCSQSASAQGVFTITSSSFKDGERLATKMAGNNKQNPNCVGDNVSPALSWSNPPAGTKSYALIMYDPEGRLGLGVVHWVAYGIAASVTGFAEGEASKQTDKYVGGKSTMSLAHYFGPCTPPGAPHHYMFTLIATDLEPTALQAGMTRDEVMKALDGHAKGATGIIGTFSKP